MRKILRLGIISLELRGAQYGAVRNTVVSIVSSAALSASGLVSRLDALALGEKQIHTHTSGPCNLTGVRTPAHNRQLSLRVCLVFFCALPLCSGDRGDDLTLMLLFRIEVGNGGDGAKR